MSHFFDEWQEAAIDLDIEFGEPFLVTPVSVLAEAEGDVNDTPQPDPCRPQIPVTMIFHEQGKAYFPRSRGIADSSAQRTVGAEIMVSAMQFNLPWSAQNGDLMLRAKTGVVYRVARFEPDDTGRLWFSVTVER